MKNSKRILSVVIKTYSDKRSDTSYLQCTTICEDHIETKNPTCDVCKEEWEQQERWRQFQDGQFDFIGIRAEAEIGIPTDVYKHDGTGLVYMRQIITSGGLWGIESDSGKDYLEEVANEELRSLRDQLKKLRFSSRSISTAFKDVSKRVWLP